MSSRIIRGDGRLQKLKISSSNQNAQARDQVMDVEKQAFEEGYAEGERIGKQMGEAKVEAIFRKYEKSLAELAVAHREMIQDMEEQTVRLALEVARKIIQRELALDPDIISALAAVALKRVSSHQAISLHVSHHDFEAVRTTVAGMNPAVTVKEDPALERGDFLIETGQTHLDGRVSSQIDAIGKALFDE